MSITNTLSDWFKRAMETYHEARYQKMWDVLENKYHVTKLPHNYSVGKHDLGKIFIHVNKNIMRLDNEDVSKEQSKRNLSKLTNLVSTACNAKGLAWEVFRLNKRYP